MAKSKKPAKIAPKRANKKKRISQQEQQEIEKELNAAFADYEIKELKKAKTKIRASARYYLAKGNKKKYESKMRSLTYFNSQIDFANESFGVSEKRKDKRLREDLDFDFFNADFEFNERNQILDYVFKNVEIKTYKGKRISEIADSIIKEIDNILSGMTYEYMFIIETDWKKKNIVSFFKIDKAIFEEL